MAFIETIAEEAADGQLADVYASERERRGYLPNYALVFSHAPAVYAAWAQLNGAIKASMSPRRYELVSIAAARRLRSSYCALAHGSVLAGLVDDEALRDAVNGGAGGRLDAADAAAMRLADKVVDDAASIAQEDVDELRALGLSDADVAAVVTAAAARCFFAKTLDALGAEPDPAYHELDAALREPLTVGRPIAEP